MNFWELEKYIWKKCPRGRNYGNTKRASARIASIISRLDFDTCIK
jgi:hypothetical protein